MGAFDDIPSVPVSGKPSPGIFDDVPEAKTPSRVEQIAAKMKEMEKASGSTRLLPKGVSDVASDAGSLSLIRPVGSAIRAGVTGLTDTFPGSTFGERYQAGVKRENERQAEAESDVGAPGTVATKMVAGLPAAAVTGPGYVTGAAVPGFIEGASQNADSFGGALVGGAKQAGSNVFMQGLLNRALSLTPWAKRGAAAEAEAVRGRSPDEIRSSAKELYKRLDDSGIAYSPQQTSDLYVALQDMRNRAQYSPNAHPTLTDFYDQLTQLSRSEASFTKLHDLRSAIAAQARGPDESTRKAAGQMIGEIDKLIGSGAPAVNPKGVNIAADYPEASRLWKAASLADDVGWIADKTGRKAQVKSGINPDEVTRGNFAKLEERINKPGAYNPFNEEQRDLLSNVIKGGRIQNLESSAGTTMRQNAPWLGGVAATGAGAIGLTKGLDPSSIGTGAAVVGLPVTAAAKFGGAALQRAAATRGQENVNALLRNITTGSSAPPVPGAAIDRKDLARIMFDRDLSRLLTQQGPM